MHAKDRCINDISVDFFVSLSLVCENKKKSHVAMTVFLVKNHRTFQNLARTSEAHSPVAHATFLFLPHLTSSDCDPLLNRCNGKMESICQMFNSWLSDLSET